MFFEFITSNAPLYALRVITVILGTVASEKERINTIKDIAVAYYKSKPTTVSYTYLTR